MSRLAMPQKTHIVFMKGSLLVCGSLLFFTTWKVILFFLSFFLLLVACHRFFTLMPYYLIWIWNDPSYDDDMISLLLKFVAQSKEMTLSWKQTFVKRISLLLSVLKASRIIYVLLEDVYNPLHQNYTYLL